MTFVKWPKLLVWHIRRVDNTTVCGLPIGPTAGVTTSARRTNPGPHIGEQIEKRVCKSCDRMAESMRTVLA